MRPVLRVADTTSFRGPHYIPEHAGKNEKEWQEAHEAGRAALERERAKWRAAHVAYTLGERYGEVVSAKEHLVRALDLLDKSARAEGKAMLAEQAHALIGMVAIAFTVADLESELSKEESAR